MVRNQYSYWLTVKPDTNAKQVHTLDEIETALNDSYLAFCMAFWTGPDDYTVTGELKDDVGGSVEEDGSMRETVATIAAWFPDYDFTFEERDEDDHSNICITKWHGVSQGEVYARTLEPGELDAATKAAIVEGLRANGYAEAAGFVDANFKT